VKTIRFFRCLGFLGVLSLGAASAGVLAQKSGSAVHPASIPTVTVSGGGAGTTSSTTAPAGWPDVALPGDKTASCNTVPVPYPGAENAPANHWPRTLMGSKKPAPPEPGCDHKAPARDR
jgi:hypothetical protein